MSALYRSLNTLIINEQYLTVLSQSGEVRQNAGTGAPLPFLFVDTIADEHGAPRTEGVLRNTLDTVRVTL